jgi:hypothetical protein
MSENKDIILLYCHLSIIISIYFANSLFPIFFFSIIWFTSKLANNTEIIAILIPYFFETLSLSGLRYLFCVDNGVLGSSISEGF